jgi:hypothetical protein
MNKIFDESGRVIEEHSDNPKKDVYYRYDKNVIRQIRTHTWNENGEERMVTENYIYLPPVYNSSAAMPATQRQELDNFTRFLQKEGFYD